MRLNRVVMLPGIELVKKSFSTSEWLALFVSVREVTVKRHLNRRIDTMAFSELDPF